MTGSASAVPAKYNLMFPHIDRMSSYLFSPSDVNFRVSYSSGEYSKNIPKDWSETFMQMFSLLKKQPQPLQWNDWQEMGRIGAHYLNYEFSRTGVDIAFASAIDWALVKGSTFVRTLWGHDGFEPYVIQPEMMGVLREDVNKLNRQEAFTMSTYITMDQFRQRVKGMPDEEKMIKRVRTRAKNARVSDQYENDFLRQVVIGGIATAAAPSQNIKASVQVLGMPAPAISPHVIQDLLLCHELWIQDDDKEDWTTIQLIEPDIIIEGKLRRRNLSGVKGDTGFQQICPNPMEGYFWGMSEFQTLAPLQDMVNQRVNEINRVLKKRARPAWAMTGFSGDSDNIKKAMDSPDGVLVEQVAGAKVEKMQPDKPDDAYASLKETVNMFDLAAGFQSIMRGEGEGGVRSGVHADTLVRTASPRMRDRAILIEKQCSALGDFCFRLLQQKETRAFVTQKGDEFLLSQIPDDCKVSIDSHSSSPAFSEDNRQMAYVLAKLGAIDHESLLQMVHPPMEDELVQKARSKSEAQAKLIAEHPELLTKGKKK